MNVINVTHENYEEIKSKGGAVLLDFYADWCGPCRMIAPIIAEIASERNDITVGKINVDKSPELAREYGIYSIPTLVVLKDGKEAARAAGARPKGDILSLIE